MLSQLAKHFGAEVTAVCSASGLDMVKSLGADHVIDYTRENISDKPERYDIIFDTVGKLPKSEYSKALAPTGTFVTMARLDTKERLENLLEIRGADRGWQGQGGHRPLLSTGANGRSTPVRGCGAQEGECRDHRSSVNNPVLLFPVTILIGLGATLLSDLWALLLKRAFNVVPSNMCLVGRWLLYMPEGIFTHSSLASAPRKNGECAYGWVTHYGVGALFAMIFVAIAGSGWLLHPALIPAMCFAALTLAAPFLIMQPCFGLGVAASRTPNPMQARVRTVMNHAAFGVGLFIFGLLAKWLA